MSDICPDGGQCHHACGDETCWRVQSCSPLSEYGVDWRVPGCLVCDADLPCGEHMTPAAKRYRLRRSAQIERSRTEGRTEPNRPASRDTSGLEAHRDARERASAHWEKSTGVRRVWGR